MVYLGLVALLACLVSAFRDCSWDIAAVTAAQLYDICFLMWSWRKGEGKDPHWVRTALFVFAPVYYLWNRYEPFAEIGRFVISCL